MIMAIKDFFPQNFKAVLKMNRHLMIFQTVFLFFSFFLVNYLFIFGCAWWAVLQFWRVRATLQLPCTGFFLFQRLLLWLSTDSGTWVEQLQLLGSRAQAQQLWCGAQLLHSMWDLHGSGTEPVSPALAGEFLSIEPTGETLFLESLKEPMFLNC